VPFAVRAPCRELPELDAEDAGQPLDLIRGEPALPTTAAAFGGAHSGVTPPTHQLTKPRLRPSVALAQDADIRADDRGLRRGDLARAVTTAAHHKAACQVTE
jgi:hypothetical protein